MSRPTFDREAHRRRYPDGMTLGEARAALTEGLDDGLNCPCCGQRAQLYRRSLNASMVNLLHAMHEAGGTTRFVHAKNVAERAGLGQQGDAGKLAYFGLVEEEKVRRQDGGRAGYWRVTEQGRAFLHSQHRVPRWACVFDGRVSHYEGGDVGIKDVAGLGFDFRKLMATGKQPASDNLPRQGSLL